ncbi:MAG: hypothetical protein LBI61_01365 [Puniceicoccales bacterium]|nr:hypothetical protein [Puniceicoccales bacterium]
MISAFSGLVFCNARLVIELVDAQKEHSRLRCRVRPLLEKTGEAEKQLAMKQDHMRKMLTNKDFMEQVVREKAGYIGQKEKIFRFED